MIIQLSTILLVVLATYLFFRLFGPRGKFLFLSRREKAEWDAGLQGNLGSWVTITNISGTITSFATVLFLMGSVKLFGLFSLSTGITIFIGAFVTNYFTKRLVRNPYIARRFEESDQTAGVIAFLLWSDSAEGRILSRLTKWISLLAIASIVWLEFLIFSEFTSASLGIVDLEHRSLVMFATAFLVIYFVLRYGIRGFTFADFLHGPLIALAALVLFVAVVMTFWAKGNSAPWSDSTFFAPQLSTLQGLVFAAHVLVLNCLQVLCTEPHWLRVWLFGDRETNTQVPAMAMTGLLWVGMLAIGMTAAVSSGIIGDGAILHLVNRLAETSLVFPAFFWVAVTAAIFSTADTQAYCLLLVSKFNPLSGSLSNIRTDSFHPVWLSAGAATACTIAYFGVRWGEIPIEKLIFVIIPSVVTLAPPLVIKALGRQPRPAILLISLTGYIMTAAVGFIRPEAEFYWTLSAVFVPLLVTILGIPLSRRGNR